MENQIVKTLRAEYLRRAGLNPRYSLRAFAKNLGLPSGRLSELLSGKRNLTKEMAFHVLDRLELPLEERRRLLDQHQPTEATESVEIRLREDEFSIIADWYHFAILSLLETRDFQNEPAWIARRLGLNTITVQNALERLHRLGLIKEMGGKIVSKQCGTSTTHDVPSGALRQSHRQSLEQAIRSLDEISVELRDITSVTMAIDIEKIPQAKKLIRTFRRRMCKFLESDQKTEVYNLNIQLVPVSRVKER